MSRRDVHASTVFAKEIADVGDDAIEALGKEMVSLADDIKADESPLQLLMAAAVGLEHTRSKFFKGAVAAARSALDARRADPVAFAAAKAAAGPAPSGEFFARDTDTVAITCRADYAGLKKLMEGSGYEPAKIQVGTTTFGVVHVYFNQVGSTKYGDYQETLVLASAWPENTVDPVVAKQPDNPFDYLVPALKGAPYFALKVFIAGPQAVVDFGRQSLGLDKVKVPKPKFQVNAAKLDIKIPGVVSGTLNLAKSKTVLKVVAEDLRDALDIPQTQPLPPPPTSLAYRVVTHTAKGEPFLTWTWLFKTPNPPVMNAIKKKANGKHFWTFDKKMKAVLGPLNVEPMVSTWTFGLVGSVKDVTVVGAGSSSP